VGALRFGVIDQFEAGCDLRVTQRLREPRKLVYMVEKSVIIIGKLQQLLRTNWINN